MRDWAASLAALVHERGAALYGFAYVLTGSASEAEELLEGATMRAFRAGRGSDDLESAYAEVRRGIATAFLREARRSPSDAGLLTHEPPTYATGDDATPHLQVALLTLAPAERLCVVLAFLEDLPMETVATQSRLSEAAVERHLATGIAGLRALGVELDFTEHFTIAVADARAR